MLTKQLLSEDIVNFHLNSNNKKDAINELIDMLKASNKLNDVDSFRNAVFLREELDSTGIGMSVAIPHARGNMVKSPCIAFGKTESGIDFGSIDGEEVRIIFLIAVPENEDNIHLKIITNIARMLIHDDIRKQILECDNYERFIQILSSEI